MNELVITKKEEGTRGDDGYKIVSLRISNELLQELENICAKTGRSRNEIVTMLIQYGLQNYTISE